MKQKFLFLFCAFIMPSVFFVQAQEPQSIEHAHFAGSWYPAEKDKLTKSLDYYFSLAAKHFPIADKNDVVALIVPHAGHHFSGLCAAAAYQAIKNKSFDRVIVIGPSHKKRFRGIALPTYNTYQTPMGNIAIDQQAITTLRNTNQLFKTISGIYQQEHSIEIELPFIQYCLKNISLVPCIIGELQEQEVRSVIKSLSMLLHDRKKNLIIISTDFAHYGSKFGYTPSFNDAIAADNMAIDAILEKSFKKFNTIIEKTGDTICGKDAINLLLHLIAQDEANVDVSLACSYNSAQLENSRKGNIIDVNTLSQEVQASSFVHYASLIFTTKLTQQDEIIALKLARNTITEKLFPEKKQEALPIGNNLKKSLGAFVTLRTKGGELRGCIGHILPQGPLYTEIPQIALSAAFQDSRFSPLKQEELADIKLSISILTPPHSIKGPEEIVIGKHGIILEKDGRLSVFLPEVATEQGWSKKETLEHLSRKAGLPENAWKTAKFKVFAGFKFSE